MRFLPVVHPVTYQAALDAVALCVSAGVKGLFLINQGINTSKTVDLFGEVRNKYPNLWIGINLLGKTPRFAEMQGLNGIWADNALGVLRPARAFTYFGGVDFKYQKPVPPSQYASAIKACDADVVTTSGPGTGKAPTLEKILNFRKVYAGPLAIASGMNEENIQPFLEHVNYFLIGTGIEKEFGILDPQKVERMVKLLE